MHEAREVLPQYKLLLDHPSSIPLPRLRSGAQKTFDVLEGRGVDGELTI